MERRGDRLGRVRRRPVDMIQRHRDLEHLLAIAHVGGAAHRDLAIEPAEPRAALPLHRGERGVAAPRRRCARRAPGCASARPAGRCSACPRPTAPTPRAAPPRAPMPSSAATAETCSPAAPPKASSAKRRGSTPRRTVATRTPSAMRALTRRWMPDAAALQRQAQPRPRAAPTAAGAAARSSARRAAQKARRDRDSPAPDWHPSPSPPCRPGRSRRARDRRRRSPAPRAAARSGRACAIEPPPAPSVTMSSAGSAMRASATARPPATASARPSCTSAMSVLGAAHVEGDQVARRRPPGPARPPPPRRRPGRTAPCRPPAAPPRPTEATPPCDRMTNSVPAIARLCQPRLQAAQIGARSPARPPHWRRSWRSARTP